MLCYVRLCYVMLCYVMLCYVMCSGVGLPALSKQTTVQLHTIIFKGIGPVSQCHESACARLHDQEC